jgi:hypothetical protein
MKMFSFGASRLVYRDPFLFVFQAKTIHVFNFLELLRGAGAKPWVARLGDKKSLCVNELDLRDVEGMEPDTLQILSEHGAVVSAGGRRRNLFSFFSSAFGIREIARVEGNLPPVSPELYNFVDEEYHKHGPLLISSMTRNK